MFDDYHNRLFDTEQEYEEMMTLAVNIIRKLDLFADLPKFEFIYQRGPIVEMNLQMSAIMESLHLYRFENQASNDIRQYEHPLRNYEIKQLLPCIYIIVIFEMLTTRQATKTKRLFENTSFQMHYNKIFDYLQEVNPRKNIYYFVRMAEGDVARFFAPVTYLKNPF